jgi:hypothetical protein
MMAPPRDYRSEGPLIYPLSIHVPPARRRIEDIPSPNNSARRAQ